MSDDPPSHHTELQPLPDLAPERPLEFVEDGGDVLLLAGQSVQTGAWTFPVPPPADRDDATSEIRVGPTGTLYSFSTIHVSSTRPVPYTLGYVDFPGGLRVLAVVKHDEGAELACDTKVVLRCGDGQWWVEPEVAS